MVSIHELSFDMATEGNWLKIRTIGLKSRRRQAYCLREAPGHRRRGS